jgi:hypothetical protein
MSLGLGLVCQLVLTDLNEGKEGLLLSPLLYGGECDEGRVECDADE